MIFIFATFVPEKRQIASENCSRTNGKLTFPGNGGFRGSRKRDPRAFQFLGINDSRFPEMNIRELRGPDFQNFYFPQKVYFSLGKVKVLKSRGLPEP